MYGQRGSQVSPSSRRCTTLEPQKGRLFGGSAADRAAPCRLFRRDFARENAEAQEREFDFIFRHGTMVLRVEEDNFGRITPVVSGLGHFDCFIDFHILTAHISFNRLDDPMNRDDMVHICDKSSRNRTSCIGGWGGVLARVLHALS